jgi:hypothetical protein
MNTSPDFVRNIPLAVRSNNEAFKVSSILFRPWVSADCERLAASAALVMLPSQEAIQMSQVPKLAHKPSIFIAVIANSNNVAHESKVLRSLHCVILFPN